jgi:signal peptidase
MNVLKLTTASQPSPEVARIARRYGWGFLVLSLLLGWALFNVALRNAIPAEANLYVLQPVFWLYVALMAFGLRSAEGEPLRLLDQRGLVATAAMLGGAQVAVMVLLGLLAGFGRSPYAHTWLIGSLNVWFVATRLVGVEAARWYLGQALGRRSAALGFLGAWLVPLFLLLPFGQYSQLGEAGSALRVAGQTLLPLTAENLLAAQLALSAGPLASLAYRGVLQGFEWLSPILPDLSWMVAAFVGVLVPIAGLLFIAQPDSAAKPDEAAPASPARKSEERASVTGWLLVAGLAVGVIWLNSGFLGIRPSLVSGNSMNPALYPGDVVFTRTIAPEAVQVGDVIRFRRDGLDVVHRVAAIETGGAGLVFTTRGDNNNVDDAPVLAEHIQGKLVLTLPKIGWIGIGVRLALAWVGGLL